MEENNKKQPEIIKSLKHSAVGVTLGVGIGTIIGFFLGIPLILFAGGLGTSIVILVGVCIGDAIQKKKKK